MVTKTTKPATKKAARPNTKKVGQREIEEIQNLDEPLPISNDSKSRGRPKNENYLPFKEAREFIRGEMLPSRNGFEDWYNANKPKAIPRFPYRVYKEEWVTWNDFLGTQNVFAERTGKSWRSIEEAALWVHTLNIETYTKWIEYCRENTLPSDIPARPDIVYKSWKSWGHWLGNKVIKKVETVREAQKVQIFYIIQEQGYPENVLTFGMDKMGPANFKARWEQENFLIIKMFWFDPKHAAQITNIVNSLSSPYLGEDKTRIVPNIWEICWHLSMILELFRP